MVGSYLDNRPDFLGRSIMSSKPFPIADKASKNTLFQVAFLTGTGLDQVLLDMCISGDELYFEGKTYRFEVSPEGTPRPIEVAK